MFVHITVFFVYFINKSGEEDPENSPAVVFVSPFSVCVGFCVCGLWDFSPLLYPSPFPVFSLLFGSQANGVTYILGMGNKETSGTKSCVMVWIVFCGGIWPPPPTSAMAFTFESWPECRERRKDVPSWGKMLPGVGRTLIIHFHGSAGVPCCW